MFRRINMGTMLIHGAHVIVEWTSSLFPETFYRRLQERRFPDAIKTRLGKDTTVVANDHILKFHTHDRREEYRRRFLEISNIN